MTLDLIVSTRDTAEGMPLKDYMSMLWIHGKFVTVGLPDKPLPTLAAFDFAPNGCFLGGSHIGNKEEAVEMLQLAADRGIKPWYVGLLVSLPGPFISSRVGSKNFR
jgi:alcohol dehydrogenase (NADP+)